MTQPLNEILPDPLRRLEIQKIALELLGYKLDLLDYFRLVAMDLHNYCDVVRVCTLILEGKLAHVACAIVKRENEYGKL
jgi:hypothetical protein